MKNKFKTFWSIFRSQGVIGILIVLLDKINWKTRKKRLSSRFKTFTFLAETEDILSFDIFKDVNLAKSQKKDSYTINWVMNPPSASGGGHQNIYRFIKFLQDAGHTCRIYLYCAGDRITIEEVLENTSANYAKVDVSIDWFENGMEVADAVIATGWETAYPVFNSDDSMKKFYFVQDFEPWFYVMGSEYKLAENTYRMGLHGLTAGPWLSHKLTNDYGMSCDYYDFGFDPSLYQFDPNQEREKLFFYARPVTPRRGFELGILALELFHEKFPDVEIVMAGWDVSDYKIGFPYTNLKSLDIEHLSGVYNTCYAALVLSLSNVSLLPIELMSCGVIPILNDGPNNEMVLKNSNVVYAGASPAELAKALIDVFDEPAKQIKAEKVASSVQKLTWDESAKQFISAFERVMNG